MEGGGPKKLISTDCGVKDGEEEAVWKTGLAEEEDKTGDFDFDFDLTGIPVNKLTDGGGINCGPLKLIP